MSNTESLSKTLTLEAVAATKRLPSLPSVAQRMLEIAQQDEPDYRDLCQAIRSDPAISGRVLKTVNSALFALRPKIESIEDAVPRLGISMIRTLILGFHLSTWKANSRDGHEIFRSIWRSCLTQAVIAELLAEKTNLDASACFTGGMLQDIGVLAMVNEIGDDYVSQVLQSCDRSDMIEVEKRCFGFTHVDVSAEVLQRWNMGRDFIDAINRHHLPTGNSGSSSENVFAAILQAASLGAAALAASRSLADVDDAFTAWMRFLNCHFGFNPCDAKDVISEIEERVTEYSVIFNFDISDSTSCGRVVERANDLLADIALESQLKMVAIQRSMQSKSIDDPIKDAVYRDYLSGLYNRRFLNESLNTHLDSWVNNRKPIAVLYMDVDKFKSINDSCGHSTGDLAIKHVADWLRKCTRENDYVFRLGGDEFLVVMQIKEKHYKSVACRLASDLPDLECPAGTIPISLSIGGVYYLPKRGDKALDPQVLIDQADKQMYAAKNAGGNRTSLI